MGKRILFSALAGLVSLGLLLAGAEIILRVFGDLPADNFPLKPGEPRIYQADVKLGWTTRQGGYSWIATEHGGLRLPHTFWENGVRATSRGRSPDLNTAILLGCSYTEGYSVADQDTFAWKLKEGFPNLEWLNYGCGGYSTYQSLLVLEEILPKLRRPPAVVLYGFCSFHMERNTRTPAFQRLLINHSSREQIKAPYCTYDSDRKRLVRHPPEAYPCWPLREYSTLVTWSEWMYASFVGRQRTDYANQLVVTRELLKEMDSFCAKYNTKLFVVILGTPQQRETVDFIERFLASQHIWHSSCVPTLWQTEAWKTPWEGHPDSRMNAQWSKCIIRSLHGHIQ